MSISERATASIKEMPERDRPISEEFRLVAKAWVDAQAAADLLEDTKSAVLAQMMLALDDKSMSAKEMRAKASQEWHEHLEVINNARKEANLKKVQMEYVRMRFSEWMAIDATQRNERRMSR